jgi:TnpA family transposase
MLKRLGAYPRQNGLALALREIGRIERTLHALIMWNTARKSKVPRL